MKHTTDALHIDIVAIGILRHADQLVMVRQADQAGRRYWSLPGGLVEGGELADEGLKREVREESGVGVAGACTVAFLSHIDRPLTKLQTMVFGFEVEEWRGELKVGDPDGEVEEVALVPFVEACQRLRENGGWPGIQGPLLAYLEGRARVGTVWFYRESANDQQLASVSRPRGEPEMPIAS